MFEGREVAGGACSRGGVKCEGENRGTAVRRQCRRGRSQRDHREKVVVEEEEEWAAGAEVGGGGGGARMARTGM